MQANRERRERAAAAKKEREDEKLKQSRLKDLAYRERAEQEFKGKLESGESLSMEECISLVERSKNANISCGNFTFLEEAILSQSWQGVRAATGNKAWTSNISKCLKERYGRGFTLLHLAVLLPEEMRELCQLKRIDKEKSLENPHASLNVVAKLLNVISDKNITIPVLKLVKDNIARINDPNIKKEYETIAQMINEKINAMTPEKIGISKEKAAQLLSGEPGTVKKFIDSQKTQREENNRQQCFEKRMRKKGY
jgi:hypothetical protein